MAIAFSVTFEASGPADVGALQPIVENKAMMATLKWRVIGKFHRETAVLRVGDAEPG